MAAATSFPPVLPARVQAAFGPLCQTLPPAEVTRLKAAVTAHVAEVHHAAKLEAFLDLGLAVRMATVLETLLDGYAQCSEAHQRLIVGAARYFAQLADADTDTATLIGFEDDLEVLTYVLLAIGRVDLSLKLL